MEYPRTPRPGLLADIEQLEQDARKAQLAAAEASGTATAGDDLIEATVTGQGELTELVLDPRVYRELGPEELAAEIVLAVGEARTRARHAALEVLVAGSPPGSLAIGDDPAFGPWLAHLEQMRSTGRPV
ncbi:YbaB/EbfC family nucleoid-associated protein [Kribbella sp. NPDC056345]|uniref:YbaB/EbfC family nucleoid-associated protein n=1 Tax=Kribbella sp. NPDC056345 TaxID=3345789 RepID=UPI0035DE8CA2